MSDKEEREKLEEILKKREELAKLEDEYYKIRKNKEKTFSKDCLNQIPKWAVERYSRHLILRDFGYPALICKKLMDTSVLIIGLGGLGCPASSYLAGAGIGRIGLLDFDTVESSNLARQILHSETLEGVSKVRSAEMALKRINSHLEYVRHEEMLTSENALKILKKYDIILDCTDNLPTRYLINDACILLGKPLVSASALRTDGMLTVYNCKSQEYPDGGPCFRCIFPTPPEDAGSCSTAGILGPVVGVMGTMQALETLKVIFEKTSLAGRLVIFDGMDATMKNVKLRNKNPECLVCSENPTIKKLIDYPAFCKTTVTDKDFKLDVLNPEDRISASNMKLLERRLVSRYSDRTIREDNIENLSFPLFPDVYLNMAPALLVDVRPSVEYRMYKLPFSLNCPYDNFADNLDDLLDVVHKSSIREVYFICRRGNDSQLAARDFKAALQRNSPKGSAVKVVKDVIDGLVNGWKKTVDNNIPTY